MVHRPVCPVTAAQWQVNILGHDETQAAKVWLWAEQRFRAALTALCLTRALAREVLETGFSPACTWPETQGLQLRRSSSRTGGHGFSRAATSLPTIGFSRRGPTPQVRARSLGDNLGSWCIGQCVLSRLLNNKLNTLGQDYIQAAEKVWLWVEQRFSSLLK